MRGFGDMGKRARDWMIRDKFIAAQRSCVLRRHLDGVSSEGPVTLRNPDTSLSAYFEVRIKGGGGAGVAKNLTRGGGGGGKLTSSTTWGGVGVGKMCLWHVWSRLEEEYKLCAHHHVSHDELCLCL